MRGSRCYTRAVIGVIVAGGESRRMGRDKAFLPFGGTTLVERVAARLRDACDDVVIVTNNLVPYEALGLRAVHDALPHRRSLAGIYTGVLQAGGPVFVCGCDMPFLCPALVRHMGVLAEAADVVIPRVLDYEPLHAVYTPACLAPMKRVLAEGGRNADVLRGLTVVELGAAELRRLDPDLRSLLNINTPEEYASALSLAGAVR
ncbi:MAG TPA: molybdenum cofactor guanylyltransferase [bacterium]|nr:molybdenum cofactor guanylyltransferase [bacterium]